MWGQPYIVLSMIRRGKGFPFLIFRLSFILFYTSAHFPILSQGGSTPLLNWPGLQY